MFTLHTLKLKAVMPLAGALLMAASVISCRDDDNTDLETVTEAEAADAIEAAVTTDSNGVAQMAAGATAVAEDEAVYTNSPLINCGQLYTENHNATGAGVTYSYDYSGTHTYQLTCSAQGFAESFAYTYDMDGTYETARMYSDDNATANVAITGLAAGIPDALINGSYVRNGYQESKVRQMRHFNSLITINLDDVVVNKTSRQITGGTASVSMTGTGSAGNTFSYNGTITFNGNQSATLVINGTTYNINL
ncbi:hypothetical protein ACLI09_06790 [Flavobacterium sp. RHBU_24]|uniref:hypothetical protein n=1 Tax=Flavobacterium sp. RHBU_24 TaxID=3391185 RepID=UPI00398508E8